ncbi:hypothetical protein [Maribacter arenosus]|uniref:Beta-lactamase-inhibitor-like, PepSY-like n=1 Tax=Maribacter arenosus TaxID=1854708 RepID=A0ABR7VJ80_9FLAO|nr:hypothetical protein [Maribacter arenosus]MBD0852538.1 hypothetical protein [Maribacter arenosus]
MNRKTILLGFIAGLLFVNGMFANDPRIENDDLDLNTIEYVEDDIDFDLGFNTADYLPEDFDPNQVYFNINSIDYIKEEWVLQIDTKKYLPKGFDPYAYPSDVESINYIDENDAFEFNLDSTSIFVNGFNSNTNLSK